MALPKLFQRIFWHNSTTPAVNEDNLNAMSKGLSDVDDRLIDLAGTIMEDVPQIQEDIEELEEDFALIDEKIAEATSEANRATTKANEAAASVISAENKALVSEGYAKGTQNGTPVGSSSPYYHNNAEYFKEQARSFTPEGYQDLVDDVQEAQEAITDIEGQTVSSNDAYVLRQSKGNMVDLGLVGGSIAWNQLSNWQGHPTNTINGVTFTNNTDGSFTVDTGSGTATATAIFVAGIATLIATHKYFVCGCPAGGSDTSYRQDIRIAATDIPITSAIDYGIGKVFAPTDSEATAINIKIRVNNGASVSSKKFYPQLFDLTQMFGSTIADYIYSLEQATAGAGVAWFRKYFPNVYYGHQSGKIESVNVASRKVVGKNLCPPLEYGALNTTTGLPYDTTGNVRTGFIPVIKDKTYTIKLFDDYRILARIFYYDTAENFISSEVVDSGSNTVQKIFSFTGFIRIQAGTPTIITSVYNRVQVEIGSNATEFEPYQSSTYAFDSSKQLRGIPQLVNNKLSYDGDIYTADGTITRKYGIVDLSTLTWTYYSDNNYYISDSLANVIRRATDNSSISNWLLCDKTISNSANNVYLGNIGVAVASNGRLYYKDINTSSTTPPTGNLVYELATPTTESATAFQNPQRAFIDGTEEFVDAEVTTSTRDVSIPVGNESEYNTSVVLPISQDYTDGAMEILKEIVASSSDFADFKTKVAAL